MLGCSGFISHDLPVVLLVDCVVDFGSITECREHRLQLVGLAPQSFNVFLQLLHLALRTGNFSHVTTLRLQKEPMVYH